MRRRLKKVLSPLRGRRGVGSKDPDGKQDRKNSAYVASAPSAPRTPGHEPKHNQSGIAESLWDRAYAALGTENRSLVEEYEKLLSKELPGTGSELNASKNTTPSQAEQGLDEAENRINHLNVVERRTQLKVIMSSGLQRADEKKFKYTIAGHECVLQDQLAKAAKFVQCVKGLIDETVKASPEASLVWAGICVILPLLTQRNAAEQANRDGFTYVTTRMRFYAALEPLLLPRNYDQASIPEDLKDAFEDDIVDLYRHVLEFQIKSVLRFYRSRSGNLGRDLIQHEDWNAMLLKVRDLEKTLDGNFKKINDQALRQELQRLNSTANESLENMQGIILIAEEMRDISKGQLQTQEEQLQAQKEQLQAQENTRKNECHQLFRLKTGSATYEWYKGRVEDRIEGTCQWFLKHENFQAWLERDSGLLLVSADPGCGKSVLAKYLIDEGLPRSATICYFFFKDQDQNTVRQALCALLHQLFSHKPSLIRHAMPEYSKNGQGLIKTTTLLWDILEKAGQDEQAGPVIIVLDALDECAESDFQDLIRMLRQLFPRDRQGRGKMKCLLTSRPYKNIVSKFHGLVDDFPLIRIPGEGEEASEAISQEVNHVIKYRVTRLPFSAPIKDQLQKQLLGIPHRTYLWVYLVFDYLAEGDFKMTTKGVDKAIATLPQTVNEAYERILDRSKEHSVVRKALSIILAASRPLKLAEMNVAVNIEIGSQSMEDVDLEREEDFASSLRSWCGLFVSIHHGKVYFLHQTAREFLLADLSSANVPPRWHHSITTRDAHMVLAEACVVYLNFFNSDINLTDGTSSRHTDNSTFLDYSAENWAAHFRKAQISSDAAIVPYALRICDPDSKSYLAWFKIYQKTQYIKYRRSFTSLGVASYFGHEAVVRLLLEKGADIEAKDEDGRTPLLQAVMIGRHEAIVQLLLEKGADIEAKDEDGRTPLSQAVIGGHKAIIQLLLEKGADTEVKDRDGRTPLLWVVMKRGDKVIVRLLLEKGADIEVKDRDGQTPLLWAVMKGGDNAIVQLLLEKGADIEVKDGDGQTPLLWAAIWGDKAIVRLLLEKGADIEAKDGDGRTPLSRAARWGHKTVVQLLLEKGADIEAKDGDGQTPLSRAAREGDEAITQLFLEKGADIKVKDGDGRTPLSQATRWGHKAITQLFLEKGADIEAKDKYGQTPLLWAAIWGDEAIVRLLLEKGADIKGHKAIVQLLFDKGADIEVTDGDG